MTRARSRVRKRILVSVKCPFPPSRKGAIVFVELDTRRNAGYTVSLEWDRDTGETQVIVADGQTGTLLVFPVPGENAGDAFRHPFRYAP
jgi:hypothetical protein